MFTKEELEALPEDKRDLFVEHEGVFVPKAVVEAGQFKAQAEKYQSELTAYQQEEKEREEALKAQLEAEFTKKLEEAQKKHGGDSDEVRKILEEKHQHELTKAKLEGATEKEKEFQAKLTESKVQGYRKELASLANDEKSARFLAAVGRDLIKVVDGKETFFDLDGKALSFDKVEDYLDYVKKDESFQDFIKADVGSYSPDFAKGSRGAGGQSGHDAKLAELKKQGKGTEYLNEHFRKFFG